MLLGFLKNFLFRAYDFVSYPSCQFFYDEDTIVLKFQILLRAFFSEIYYKAYLALKILSRDIAVCLCTRLIAESL